MVQSMAQDPRLHRAESSRARAFAARAACPLLGTFSSPGWNGMGERSCLPTHPHRIVHACSWDGPCCVVDSPQVLDAFSETRQASHALVMKVHVRAKDELGKIQIE